MYIYYTTQVLTHPHFDQHANVILAFFIISFIFSRDLPKNPWSKLQCCFGLVFPDFRLRKKQHQSSLSASMIPCQSIPNDQQIDDGVAWRLRIIFSVVCTCLEIEKAPGTFYKKKAQLVQPLSKLGLASNYVPHLFNNSFIIHIVSFHT